MKTSLLFLLTCIHALLCGVASAQLPTVTITATDAAAAETLPGEPANPGNMRIARTGSTAGALTVWVKVSGIAVQGEDYTFGSTIGAFVIIPAGSATLDIPVNVIDDFLTEGTEDVRIKLELKTGAGDPVPYIIGAADRGIVNIADNEDPLAPLRPILTVTAVDAIATETPGGTDPAVFRIMRTNNLAPALSILYSLGGTATPGADYTTPPATITIPAGVASVDVTITPIDDTIVEPNETVIFTLLPTNVTGTPLPAEAYALGLATSATATIISDDLSAVMIISPGSGTAAAIGQSKTVDFRATDSGGYIASYAVLLDGVVVTSGVTNLPASTPPGTPYLGTATVIFPGTAGFNGFSRIAVRVTDDRGVSATSALTSVYVFTPAPPPPPPPVLPMINIFPLDVNGAEVASGPPVTASFRVTHDFPATATVSFLFAIGGSAREGVDYTLSSPGVSSFLGRWFTFPAGTTEATIVVTPIDDLLVEGTETVIMSLYTPPFNGFNEGGSNSFAPGTFGFYYGTHPTATVNILDNDFTPPPFPVVTITATDPSGTETLDGSDPIVFTVTRTSGPLNVPLTVNYTLPRAIAYSLTAPLVATNGLDFPMLPGSITIPAGATSADIVVVPTYDGISEGDELLYVALAPSATVWPDPSAYVLDSNIVATATIHDALLAPGTSVVWIRVVDALCFEENFPGRTGAFSVERNGNLANPLTVTYSISGTATNGTDYVHLPGTVTIPAGSPRITILIDPIADNIVEIGETVGITIEPPPQSGSPPAYLIGSTFIQPRSAGIRILDQRPISAQARAFYFRRQYHGILPLPVVTASAPPPPGAVAAVASAPALWSVEASTDLLNWETIGTTDPSGEGGDFVDMDAGNYGQRFYRFRPVQAAAP